MKHIVLAVLVFALLASVNAIWHNGQLNGGGQNNNFPSTRTRYHQQQQQQQAALQQQQALQQQALQQQQQQGGRRREKAVKKTYLKPGGGADQYLQQNPRANFNQVEQDFRKKDRKQLTDIMSEGGLW
jgi:transcription initiation factor TFIID subunit TAF12